MCIRKIIKKLYIRLVFSPKVKIGRKSDIVVAKRKHYNQGDVLRGNIWIQKEIGNDL